MVRSGFDFFTIKAIHKNNKEKNKDIFKLLDQIEMSPLNIDVKNNR